MALSECGQRRKVTRTTVSLDEITGVYKTTKSLLQEHNWLCTKTDLNLHGIHSVIRSNISFISIVDSEIT